MRIKYPVELAKCCRFRLYDFTTRKYIGNQIFLTYRSYNKVRDFAKLYAEFTLHRVGVTCIDKEAFRSNKFERFCVAFFDCEVC